MMDMTTILVLLIVGFFFVKKKLLPRLKKSGQEASPKKGGICMQDEMPGYRVLNFNTGDFTYTEDLAHCVEFELENVISELKKEGCQLSGDPFPIVCGSSILILLNYRHEAVQKEEAEG